MQVNQVKAKNRLTKQRTHPGRECGHAAEVSSPEIIFNILVVLEKMLKIQIAHKASDYITQLTFLKV